VITLSCVEEIESQYPLYIFSIKGGALLEKTRAGIIKLDNSNLVSIIFTNSVAKKLALRISASLTYYGYYTSQTYTCRCGGGIYKIAIFAKDPYKQISELMTTYTQLQVLLNTIQILSSLTTALI